MSQFGGGFSSQGGYGNNSQTQYSQSVARPQEYLLPITTSMLINAEERDQKLYINNKELIVVTIVGVVESFEQSDRKIKYSVMDCSGSVQVTKWIDEDQALPECHEEGTFIMVYGKPSVFNGQAQLNAYKTVTCQSYDEVTQHYLAVIHADLHAKKTGTEGLMNPAANAAVAGSSVTDNKENPENDQANFTEDQIKLLKLIQEQEGQSENGVNVNWLMERIGRDIRKDLEFLMNEGQIYDTVDQDWVKST